MEVLDALLEDGLAPDLVVAELNGCHEADTDALRLSVPLTRRSAS